MPVPESISLATTSDTIISAVCEHYSVSFGDKFRSNGELGILYKSLAGRGFGVYNAEGEQ